MKIHPQKINKIKSYGLNSDEILNVVIPAESEREAEDSNKTLFKPCMS